MLGGVFFFFFNTSFCFFPEAVFYEVIPEITHLNFNWSQS